MTAHNSAKKGDFAKVVLMPGDPLRAKWIAENFLENAKEVNHVRGMLGYTGTYKGKKVSVMGHGMGIPSIGIYSYELYKFYDVELIMRVGSAGGYIEDFKLGDVVIVEDAFSFSNYPYHVGKTSYKDGVIGATTEIVGALEKSAKELKVGYKVGRTFSSDNFYSCDSIDYLRKTSGADCVEMEAVALFANAEVLGKKAGCLLTISDNLITHEEMSPEARQTSFKDMMKIALETAIKYA